MPCPAGILTQCCGCFCRCFLFCPAGSIQYVPVESSSRIFAAGASWRLPAFVVCLASSYLQRVVAQDTLLAAAAGICSGFEAYHYSLPRKVRAVRTVGAGLLYAYVSVCLLPYCPCQQPPAYVAAMLAVQPCFSKPVTWKLAVELVPGRCLQGNSRSMQPCCWCKSKHCRRALKHCKMYTC